MQFYVRASSARRRPLRRPRNLRFSRNLRSAQAAGAGASSPCHRSGSEQLFRSRIGPAQALQPPRPQVDSSSAQETAASGNVGCDIKKALSAVRRGGRSTIDDAGLLLDLRRGSYLARYKNPLQRGHAAAARDRYSVLNARLSDHGNHAKLRVEDPHEK